jgi:hypothetical protein
VVTTLITLALDKAASVQNIQYKLHTDMADGLQRLHCPFLLVLFFLLKESHDKEIMERTHPLPPKKKKTVTAVY